MNGAITFYVYGGLVLLNQLPQDDQVQPSKKVCGSQREIDWAKANGLVPAQIGKPNGQNVVESKEGEKSFIPAHIGGPKKPNTVKSRDDGKKEENGLTSADKNLSKKPTDCDNKRDEDNEFCFNWAKANGLIPAHIGAPKKPNTVNPRDDGEKEENGLTTANNNLFKRPTDCDSKRDKDNELCFNWAKENGLIPAHIGVPKKPNTVKPKDDGEKEEKANGLIPANIGASKETNIVNLEANEQNGTNDLLPIDKDESNGPNLVKTTENEQNNSNGENLVTTKSETNTTMTIEIPVQKANVTTTVEIQENGQTTESLGITTTSERGVNLNINLGEGSVKKEEGKVNDSKVDDNEVKKNVTWSIEEENKLLNKKRDPDNPPKPIKPNLDSHPISEDYWDEKQDKDYDLLEKDYPQPHFRIHIQSNGKTPKTKKECPKGITGPAPSYCPPGKIFRPGPNCHSYYRCYWYYIDLEDCPPNTAFSATFHRCITPPKGCECVD